MTSLVENSWLVLGRIGKPWGLRGETTCQFFNPEFSVALTGVSVGISFESNATQPEQFAKIEFLKSHGKTWRLKLAGVSTPEAAKVFHGAYLLLTRDQLPKLTKGEIYCSDLVGIEVFDSKGKLLGEVTQVCNFGAGDMLEVKGAVAVFIPFRQEYFVKIALSENKLIVADDLLKDLLA
ncbi:MAG: 16S rRNA processing protein RimM [Deltaproteobacteria bacterium]|nr:16S rRNA processing protein RimM [Deltaproteobacteria bacterium]